MAPRRDIQLPGAGPPRRTVSIAMSFSVFSNCQPSFRSALTRVLMLLAVVTMIFGQTSTAFAAAATAPATVEAAHGTDAHDAHAGGHEEHAGLPTDAPRFKLLGGKIQITNSMIVTWIVALLVILGARISCRSMKEVPEGGQNFWEWMVEGLYGFLEGIVGNQLVKSSFWFFATIFIFILATNWFGLLPGVGTIGWGTPNEHGMLTHISQPLLRGGNADLNMTAAMSVIFFIWWCIWAYQSNGVVGVLKHIFAPKGKEEGFIQLVMIIVFFAVGVLECISIAFRPVSLSFRLYGNVFAGENMLESMSTLVPSLSWLLPIPFYFLELLVGIVQALVFMLLTSVFTTLICEHDEEHGHEGHGH